MVNAAPQKEGFHGSGTSVETSSQRSLSLPCDHAPDSLRLWRHDNGAQPHSHTAGHRHANRHGYRYGDTKADAHACSDGDANPAPDSDTKANATPDGDATTNSAPNIAAILGVRSRSRRYISLIRYHRLRLDEQAPGKPDIRLGWW